MLLEKQKNLISFERYVYKKSLEPDFLCNAIKKHKHLSKVQSVDSDPELQEKVRKLMNQKRIQQIKRTHKLKKVSEPDPYIKRTWVSPIEANQSRQQLILCSWKKNTNPSLAPQQSDKEKSMNVCNILNMNKKMHLFGEFMYCQFDAKQNSRVAKPRVKSKQMDILHKEYSRLINTMKKSIVICNKSSNLNSKLFVNPLGQDKYYKKIIKQNDNELTRLLIECLSVVGNFTFTSYIQFYQIFVWQQASKETQIDFVLKLLMKLENLTTLYELSQKIDVLCCKIYLTEQKDILNGFNQVMKKLMFGSQYERCHSQEETMSREEVRESLLINEECISIFVNLFYAD